MAPSPHQLKLLSRLADLDQATQWLTGQLEAAGASQQAHYVASLALEELFTNIVKYAHPDGAAHPVLLELSFVGDRFRLCLVDSGQPFDPFAQPEPDTSLPIEEREIGGLGIHFVTRLLENCTYRREDGRNIVSVERCLRCREIVAEDDVS